MVRMAKAGPKPARLRPLIARPIACTLGFLIQAAPYGIKYMVWGRPRILDFWSLGGPGGPDNPFQQVGCEAAHRLEG